MNPKIAIIGCGNIGSKLDEGQKHSFALSHAGAYQKMGYSINALADTDTDRLSAATKIREATKSYNSFDEMLEVEKIDILSICSSSSIREAVFLKAIECQIPIIVCEKPIAQTYEEALAIKKLVDKSDSTCIINYSRRWDEDIKEIKKIIDTDELGQISSIEVIYGKGILNNASHALNLLDYFFKSEQIIDFVNRLDDDRVDFDPALNVMMTYKQNGKNFPVILKATDHRNFTIWEIDIILSKGRIKFDNSGLSKKIYKVVDSPLFKGYKSLELKEELCNGYLPCMENMIKEALNIYQNNDIKTRSSIDDALETMVLIEKIKTKYNEYETSNIRRT